MLCVFVEYFCLVGYIFILQSHTYLCVFFFFKQKTAYELRISDWSSDVCSSDLAELEPAAWSGLALRGPGAGEIAVPAGTHALVEIGRASCRERVCQYV